MTASREGAREELAGSLAPPMSNGEVVFEAPWQGRVFGMARALADAGLYDWEEFRTRLIEALGAWDRRPEGEFEYYDHFLRALERLLEDKGLVSGPGVAERLALLSARPHGHDHHSHDHYSHDHHDHHDQQHGHDHDQDHDHSRNDDGGRGHEHHR